MTTAAAVADFFEMKVRMIYCCRLLAKEALATSTELVDGLGLGRWHGWHNLKVVA